MIMLVATLRIKRGTCKELQFSWLTDNRILLLDCTIFGTNFNLTPIYSSNLYRHSLFIDWIGHNTAEAQTRTYWQKLPTQIWIHPSSAGASFTAMINNKFHNFTIPLRPVSAAPQAVVRTFVPPHAMYILTSCEARVVSVPMLISVCLISRSVDRSSAFCHQIIEFHFLAHGTLRYWSHMCNPH